MPRLPSTVEGYSLTLYRPGHKHIGHFYLSDTNPPTEPKIKHMVEGEQEIIYQRRGITVYGELEAYQQPRPVNYTATFAVIKLIGLDHRMLRVPLLGNVVVVHELRKVVKAAKPKARKDNP